MPNPRSPAASAIDGIAAKHGVSAHQVALAWVTRDPICFTIPKATDVRHVEEDAAAGDLELDPADIRAIDEAFNPPHSATSSPGGGWTPPLRAAICEPGATIGSTLGPRRPPSTSCRVPVR